jgi:outer membrane protein assembly factor BamA
LKESDKLFVGTSAKYLDVYNASDKSTLSRDIKLTFLTANTPGILNIKTGFYNWFDSTGTSGFKHSIKYKVGSEPVVFQKSMIIKTAKRLENVLIGSGYLQSSVTCDSVSHKRKVKIKCELTLNNRFKIDSVFYPKDTLPMTKVLSDMYSIDFLKPGEYIQRKNIIKDRDAFVEAAHNNGYPFVTKDDIVFVVDTTLGDYQVDIHMQIRPPADSSKYFRYRYGDIYINPNFSLEDDMPTDTSNMLRKDNYKISEGYDFLSEKTLNKAFYIKQGLIYNQSRSTITSNRLLDFGIFKFVNVKTRVNPDQTLDQFYNLTTFKMESLSGEVELNNRPGNFLGLAGKTSYINKNLFKGAERFELSLSGGLETQIGGSRDLLELFIPPIRLLKNTQAPGIGQQPIINTSDITLEASLTIPSIIMPFFTFKTFRKYIPKTYMSLAANQQRRVGFFTVRSVNAKYGFKWNESEYKSSFFVPIDLKWLVLSNTTMEFDSILQNDARLALSLQTTLVLGSSYEYVYNKRNKYNPINQLYFKGTIESAGNFLNLIIDPKLPNEPGTFMGTPFAQYVRLTADVRKYWALDIGSLASRLVVGSAFAYGNSDEVPYSKQYSVGGANDLRAFGLRRIGPGSFISPVPTNNNNQFFDQTGDIKIEANVEYRFPILGYFKGAFFVDAGNVWLFDRGIKPEGIFKFDEFYKQIAVGTGFGLRLDLDFFLLRLDIAFPVRNITSTGKFDWVLDNINFLDAGWRNNNLVFNLGIGYPF